ncbi:hypothetical protein, conserved [Babesia bigemina]|uniref:C3H1-type domain-containing protein n=1 Tax=Babesia bigemina TaxID=5866 RepID=A0A061BK12_BABBI|nr:hypothetical protein, conserved [Babesia bigemina]CDR71792.1 hypothetical protein, conserved [Babesia bigemina]|eukprot:XP_012770736.1 hypothetical protein, conserved [Babesia bigemina]
MKHAKDSDNVDQPKNVFTKQQITDMKNKCIASHSRRYDDATKKALQDIEEREKQLKELENKLSIFTEKNNSDDCKNLLDNLCDGLQTFLGFNSESKGYDGTGIVYSDLDRLCDGVMGFLYQVLKDVSEKQPYSVGKTILIEIVTELKNNLSTGREGFKFIAQVAGKVGEYNERVKQGNDDVKKPINELLKRVGEHFKTEVSNILKDNSDAGDDHDSFNDVERMRDKIGDCMHFAEIFCGKMQKAKEHIADLNNNCGIHVNSALNSITYASANLHDLSQKMWRDLWDMEDKISSALESLKLCVKKHIDSQVSGLVEQLKGLIQKILDQLKHINTQLTVYIDSLEKWMKELQRVIDEVQRTHVNKIVNKQLGTQNEIRIRNISAEMEESKVNLEKYIDEDMRPGLTKLVEQAKLKVTELEGALKRDLKHVRDKVKDEIMRYVQKARKEFEEIKKNIGEPNNAPGVYYNWTKLKDGIWKDLEAIYGEGKNHVVTNYNGLRQIIDGVKTYAEKFDDKGSDTLEMVVWRWIKDILNLEPVKGWLDAYFKYNKGIGTSSNLRFGNIPHKGKDNFDASAKINSAADMHPKVIEAIMNTLRQDIANAGAQVTNHMKKAEEQSNSNKKIEIYLSAVEVGIKRFADSVQNRLKKEMGVEGIDVGKIVAEIGNKVKNPAAAEYRSHTLDGIVESTIVTLSHTASQVAAQLEKFRNTSNIANLHPAMEKIAHIADILENNPGNHGKAIDSALHNAKRNVDALCKTLNEIPLTELNTSFPDESFSSHEVQLPKLQNYATGIGANKSGKKKELEDVLTFIFTKAADLDINETKMNLVKWSTDLITHIDAFTKEIIEVGRGINWNLDNIKNGNIGYLLTEIKNNIHNLRHTNLINAMQSAYRFIDSDANSLRDTTIAHLNRLVDYEVYSALSTLTTAARRNYVSSIKSLLTAFADKVGQELRELPEEIDADLRIGFKGFMKTLEDGDKSLTVTGKENIKKLSELANQFASGYTPENFRKLSAGFRKFYLPLDAYVRGEITNVNTEENKKKNPPGRDTNAYVDTFRRVGIALTGLLEHISNENRYDHKVHGLLEDLKTAISAVKPDDFSKPNTPTMDSVAVGLSHFIKELGNVYVSAYDDAKFAGALLDESDNPETSKLTDYGRKCAKVFATLLEICNYDMKHIKEECEVRWRDRQICLKSNDDDKNDLGAFLKHCGYGVPSMERVQDNELQCKDSMRGKHVYGLFTNDKSPPTITDEHHIKKCVPKDYNYSVLEFAECLMNHLKEYYQVCHYETSTSTKYPSNINQMLTWLSGLPHSTVYDKLYLNGFADLFEKKDKEVENSDGGITFEIEGDGSDGSSIAVSTKDENKLEAYPVTITPAGLSDILAAVCSGAHDVLTSVLGHGHAGGRYACDFNTNPDKFSYPADMVTLACWLYDILRRVHHQLYFLYQQCYHNTERNGWAECYYGRYVAGSSWVCNQMQCPDQTCDQKCKQTCNQIHNQIGDQHPSCGLKSPLQSFLEDGLQGFLPHSIKFERGKMECSVKGHFNLPCKTPMGFGNISDMASHTQRGRHIYDALKRLCGDERSPLPKLCGQLSCLLPSAPKTLDDMFGFYYRLLRGWDSDYPRRQQHRETALEGAVKDANFGNEETKLDVTKIFKKNDHASKENMTHLTGDLYALVDCNGMSSSAPSHPCGRYMRPICHDMCGTFTKENADKYLSWIVYCTGSFLDLLKQLYEECNNNCAGDRPKCRVSKCKKTCNALESPMAPGSAHDDSCNSIVNCRFMRPTFYKYGLVLGDCKSLSAKTTKRTCKDLCMVLKSVTNEEESAHHPLAELVYRTIPNFLFAIRAPFIWTTVALWLLSLLYLLHIMVIRLDLLHIKSHLHSPSSHRIAAQSLLAAARVNKLNRVFYLQP